MTEQDRIQQRSGILSALSAYMLWGILPIYWKFLEGAPAPEILAHRIVWSFVLMGIILGFTGKLSAFWGEVRSLVSERKKVVGLVAASLLISMNWLIYIWAVNDGRIVETSLGYYINPLVSVILGVVVLKERLSFWQTVSFALAFIGVLTMSLRFGSVPWVALLLAATFALYALCKKIIRVGAITSITIETLLVSPIALAFILYEGLAGSSAFVGGGLVSTTLFIGTGIVTATPLLLFSNGANRLPMKVLGFLQYLAPTIALLIGVFLYHEPFTAIHAVSFGFIWLALAVFSLSGTSPFIKLEARLTKNTIFETR